ncbi:hypothetical protein V1511DRAFT_500981 [Dipodascopsis uninucleata]
MDHAIFALIPLVNSERAAIDLVERAITAQDLFTFGYLLHSSQLRNYLPESYKALLRLFANGTWKEYVGSAKGIYPELTNTAAILKLKQLSLVSLACQNHILEYSILMDQLDLQNTRDLSTLVVSCIYAKMITATLDTKSQVLRVTAVLVGRDIVDEEGIVDLQNVLGKWASQCEVTIASLMQQIRSIQEYSIQESRDVKEFNKEVEAINKALGAPSKKGDPASLNISSSEGAIGSSASGDNMLNTLAEAMDMDELSPVSDSSTTSKKRKQRIVS